MRRMLLRPFKLLKLIDFAEVIVKLKVAPFYGPHGGPKQLARFLYALTLPNRLLTDFQNYFIVRIRRKFVIILSLKITSSMSLHYTCTLWKCRCRKTNIWQERCAIAKMTAQCALHMGALKIFGTPWLRPRHYSQHFHVLLFRSTLWMFLQNLKSVALPVPEIIGGTQKIWTVPGYAHSPFSPKFLMGFYSDSPVNIPANFEVRNFTRSWDNRGYPKNLGSPWIRPRSLFSKIFNGLLFG